MKKDEISKNLSSYLYSNVNEIERQILLSLYTNYRKLEKIQNKIAEKENYKVLLNNYEKDIYKTSNGYYDDLEKIKFEILYSKGIETKNVAVSSYINDLLNEIEEMLKKDNLTEEEILKIKKQLVKIQILTGQDITFYEAAYQLFLDYYKQIQKEKIKKKS